MTPFTREQLFELDKLVEEFRLKHDLPPTVLIMMLELMLVSMVGALKEMLRDVLRRN